MKTAQCNFPHLQNSTYYRNTQHIPFNGRDLTMGQEANKSGWVTWGGSEYLWPMFKLLRFILEFIENFTFFPLLIKMHSSLEKLNGSQYKNEYSDVHLTLMTYCWAVDMPQKLMGHETGVHVLTPWWIGVDSPSVRNRNQHHSVPVLHSWVRRTVKKVPFIDFTARCTTVQIVVLRSHVVCPSFCLFVGDAQQLVKKMLTKCSLKYLHTTSTDG